MQPARWSPCLEICSAIVEALRESGSQRGRGRGPLGDLEQKAMQTGEARDAWTPSTLCSGVAVPSPWSGTTSLLSRFQTDGPDSGPGLTTGARDGVE